MNKAFFDHAMKVINELTDEDLYAFMVKHGLDFTIRQFPEPEQKEQDDEIPDDDYPDCNCAGCMFFR